MATTKAKSKPLYERDPKLLRSHVSGARPETNITNTYFIDFYFYSIHRKDMHNTPAMHRIY